MYVMGVLNMIREKKVIKTRFIMLATECEMGEMLESTFNEKRLYKKLKNEANKT